MSSISPMRSRSFASILVCSFLFSACGIDTTGISAESSRTALGPDSAVVTVTEYGDLQCPACRAAHEILTKPILKKYGDRIRFEFRHFPLIGIHPYALKAAEASECAADQGKFWEYLENNYAHQEDLVKEPYEVWAASFKLDADLFRRCLASGIKKDEVMVDEKQGEDLGVNSTPTYFVNGVMVPSKLNSITELSARIDAALGQVKNTPL